MKIINFLAGFLLLTSLFVNSEAQEVKIEDGVVAPFPAGKRFLIRNSGDVEEEINKGFKYLNYLREKAGLIPFKLNDFLSKSAYNHACYMAVNRIIGHYETEEKEGFTGVTPSDRAIYAGYSSRYVGENLSYGQKDIYESIDGLFSAIYHRLGFLDFNFDEVGIGIYENFYVYDMGNSRLSEYCESPKEEVYGQYYYDVCADENAKVPFSVFNAIMKLQPDYVLWPPVKDDSVPPAFFEESPDPLPDYSVSGYPVSISFNPYRYKDKVIKLESFELLENGEKVLTDVRILDKDKDPNHRLTEFQFVLFPLKRLKWNTRYLAVADISIDGKGMSFAWEFKTRSPGMPYYELFDREGEFPIKSGVKYAIYFEPLSPTDVINRFNYTYSSGVLIEDIGYIDPNTLYVKVKGKEGDKVIISAGTRKAVLVIANSDTAKYPENLQEVEIRLAKGWNLIGIPYQTKIDSFNLPGIQILWKFENGNWFAWSPRSDIRDIISKSGIELVSSLNSYDGVWVKTSKVVFVKLRRKKY